MSYAVSLKVTEQAMLATGQRAEFSLDHLPKTEVGRITRQFVESALAALNLNTVPAPPAADEGDETQLLELGTRAYSAEQLHVLALAGGVMLHEFDESRFVNAIRLGATPSTPARGIYLPEPIQVGPGDTLYVDLSPDGRTAVVQHNTEGAFRKRIALAMQVSEHESSEHDLLDRAAVASLVLGDVERFATQHHVELKPGQVVADAGALLWRAHQAMRAVAEVEKFAGQQGYKFKPDLLIESVQAILHNIASGRILMADVAEWAGMLTDGVTGSEVQTWVAGARDLIAHVDETLRSFDLWPSTEDLATPENRVAVLAELLDRVPPTGPAVMEGKTWGSDSSHLVLDPHEAGENTATISVYVDGDGPSVSLDAATLRDVAARLLARADGLDAAPEFWQDPHPAAKGMVGWPEVYDPEQPRASVNCCGRVECIDAAAEWVKLSTGHLGQWTVFAEKGQ